jgi:hypothetical protein
VRGGGGWRRVYGLAIEALPEETGSNKLGLTFGIPRQSSTLQSTEDPEAADVRQAGLRTVTSASFAISF